MKICFLIGSVFNLGGVQRVTSVLASELSVEHDINILCMENDFEEDRSLYNLNEKVKVTIWKEEFERNIFKRISYKIIKDINKKGGYFNKEKNLKLLTNAYYPHKLRNSIINYLNENDYDIVIGVEGYYSLLLGEISDKITAKTIGWQHNSYEAYLKNKGRYYWNRDILFEKYIPKLDEYIVLNNHDKSMYKNEKGIESKVIYNPRSFKSDEKSDVKSKTFLAAGRFNYQKGFDLLIESFKIFAKENNEWNLIIVGEGEEKDNMKKLIDKYKLNDRILIKHFTDNIKKYFLESSALLLSSRWEGMPMIVLESLEMGVPVIFYDITAIEPLVTNDKEGLVVEKYDVKAYADAMSKISKSYDLRLNMSKNSIEKSKDFDIERILKVWNDVFINCVNAKNKD